MEKNKSEEPLEKSHSDSPIDHSIVPMPNESTHHEVKLFHGTKEKFDHFDSKYLNQGSVFTTSDEKRAKEYGNPINVHFKGHLFEFKGPEHESKVHQHLSNRVASGPEVNRKLASLGYHGYKRGNEHVIFDPKNAVIEKSEEVLEKGSLQSRAPFRPKTALSGDHKKQMASWQGGPSEDRAENREMLPKMEGNARQRALHKLSGQTQTKMIEGKRHFLLHRGMSNDEHSQTVRGNNVSHDSNHSSWTPKEHIANNFANPYAKDPGKLVSAWVHEDNVHTIPKQFGAVDEDYAASNGSMANRMGNEHEVIIKPKHSSEIQNDKVAELPTSRKGDRIHDRPKNTDDAINIKGAKENSYRNGNSHPDDISSAIRSSNRAIMEQELKSKKLNKSEESLEKGANGDWEKEGYKISHTGSHKNGDLTVRAHDTQGNKVGHAQIENSGKNIVSADTQVNEEHQRKGLATAMYAHAEKVTGKKIAPVTSIPASEKDGNFGHQSSAGKALWSQSNRPFGKSEEVLQKGQSGDWKKEGLELQHSEVFPEHLYPNMKNRRQVHRVKALSSEVFDPAIHEDKADYSQGPMGVNHFIKDSNGVNRRVVASAEYEVHKGKILPSIAVDKNHRRKGLASAMHALAEEKTGIKMHATDQTSDAKALWAQKARPFGKSEMDKLTGEPLEKSIKQAATAAMMAATLGLATPTKTASPAVQSPHTQHTQHTQQQDSGYNSQKMLRTIASVESSGGKFMHHRQLGGIHQGESAYGKYGLTPLTIRETVRMNKDLQAKHGKLASLEGDDLKHYMQDNPGLEDQVASKHLSRLEHHFGQDPAMISYSWLEGIGGGYKAKKNKLDVKDHWHVAKALKAYRTQQ